MIEVKCLPHPSKYKTSVVMVNGEVWREMNAALLKKDSFPASFAQEEDWKEAWEIWEARQVKLVAYNKLSRRQYFEKELKKILTDYGFSKEPVEACLLQLKEHGYINDEEGTMSLIAKGIRKKKGPSWIQYQLSTKGLSKFDQEALYPKEQREETIREFLIKNQKKGQKAIASLARKGFALGEIIEIYRKL